MSRPGPLKDLPLDQFLPPNPNIPNNAAFRSIKSTKRPLSPGGPNLYSPTKRRILAEEGIISPEKTCKSPVSGSRTRATFFCDVLTGPSSPAKKLDFGPPKSHAQSNTVPQSRELSLEATPSRRSVPTVSRRPTPHTSPPALDHVSDTASSTCLESASSTSNSPLLIPRDLPPLPDPQSIHYPGFQIHQDPFLITYPNSEQDVIESLDMDKDMFKENVAPRRSSRKAVDESCAEVKSHPMIPMESVLCDGDTRRKAKPRSSVSHKMDVGPNTVGKTPPGKQQISVVVQRVTRSSVQKFYADEMKERRRLLEFEVDGDDVDETEV